MLRATNRAIEQYQSVANYVQSLHIKKPIHIGETGWASIAAMFYGDNGSKATDEYKQKLFYQHIREWTVSNQIACFYFEAFDEQWKDPNDSLGSENHFGLINLNSEAKFALWSLVDAGVFKGMTRNGKPITKTFNGQEQELMKTVFAPPLQSQTPIKEIKNTNSNRTIGQTVTEETYIVFHNAMIPTQDNNSTYPSAPIKLNTWEGTCIIEANAEGIIKIATGGGEWWGCALEIQGNGKGEDLSKFEKATLHFELKGESNAHFELGFQTGIFTNGTQINNFVKFEPKTPYSFSADWKAYSIPFEKLIKGGNLKDVTALMYLRGYKNNDGKNIYIRNIYLTQNSK